MRFRDYLQVVKSRLSLKALANDPIKPIPLRLLFPLIIIDVVAVVFFVLGEPSWGDAGWALFLVALFTPAKGLTYRRVGGARPYLTAFIATTSWQAVGLPIGLDSFWNIISASFIASVFVDWFVIKVMRCVRTIKLCLLLAVYASLIVHLVTVGFFLFYRNPYLGVALFVFGTVLFFVPVFYADKFVEEPK